MCRFHPTVWNTENYSQDTTPAFVHFRALQIPTVENMVTGQSPDLPQSSQHRTNGEEILSPSLEGSLTSTFWSVCAGATHHHWTWALHNCSGYHWNKPHGMQKPYGQTPAFSDGSGLSGPLGGRVTWPLTRHPGLWVAFTGSERLPHRGLHSELGEDLYMRGLWRCGVLPGTRRTLGAKTVKEWQFYFLEKLASQRRQVRLNFVVSVQTFWC